MIDEISVTGAPESVTFSNDGGHAYALSSAGVYAIDVATRRMLEALDAGTDAAGVAWSHHGNP